MRGDYDTLPAAISACGWLRLGDVRGRVFFTLDDRGPARDAYLDKADNLAGWLLFVDVEPSHPAAVILGISTNLNKEYILNSPSMFTDAA